MDEIRWQQMTSVLIIVIELLKMELWNILISLYFNISIFKHIIIPILRYSNISIFQWHLMASFAIWHQLILSDFNWCHLISSDVFWCHLMSSDNIWWHMMSSVVIWCHLMISIAGCCKFQTFWGTFQNCWQTDQQTDHHSDL